MTFTFGSLFSGIGGIDLGLQRAGFQIAWQVEIDEYATKVLAKHWPDVTRFRDVRECGSHNLAFVDLIAGGFPCQPHSLAGKRQASRDERDLWGEFFRLICELKPRWIVAENVPGLLSSENGRFFGRILSDLASVGYDAEWHVLSAAAFGASHLRERVFLVAYTSQYRCDARWAAFERPERAVSLGRGGASSSSLPNANGDRQWLRQGQPQRKFECAATSNPCHDGTQEPVADPDRQSLAVGQIFGNHAQQELAAIKRDCSTGSGIWATQSPFCGVAHGISRRVDRLRGLGNAVVPQVAEYVGRCILASIEMEAEVSA